MKYVQGRSRYQIELQPMCLDDYINEDNPVRFIDAFVNNLDMAALKFKYAELNATGRPPYDPAAMTKLYIYGYLNRVRSSRRLEAEAQRNIETMWLMEGLTPDNRTICNFRKDNAKAIKQVYREFSKLCNRLGLYGKELIAQDGTKVRANCSRHNIYSKEKAEKLLASIDKAIEGYMNKLDENDAAESDDPRYTAEDIAKIVDALNGKKAGLEELASLIEKGGGEPISLVDPDARIMKQGGEGRPFDACYNVQAAVDSKHKLISDFKVTTCANDSGELSELTESIKGIMEVETINAAGDKGYYNAADIAQCEKNGTTCYVPKTDDNGHAPNPSYDKKHFKYDKEADCYICPEGNELPYKRDKYISKGVIGGRLYQDTKVCKTCPKRDLCTTCKTSGRTINRILNQEALDIVDERIRTREGRLISNKRRELAEHPFGTVKKVWGYSQYLCRGLEMVTAEQALAFLAYNFRRVINIFKEKGENLTEAIAT